jgi:hypothetical protein
LIGSCDGGFGFIAVPLSFADETRALMDGTQCVSFDGPGYGAVCESGQCVTRENGGACGQEDPPLCDFGELIYENPCVAASPSDSRIQGGCHQPCDEGVVDEGSVGACPVGLSCRPTSVCPIQFSPFDEACTQCDAITVSLCVP